MGARWISEQLDRDKTKNIVVVDDTIFEFYYDCNTSQCKEVVFVPPRSQYIVSASTVAEGHAKGATIIVGDSWTSIADSVVTHEGKKIQLFRLGTFLKRYGHE